MTRKIRSSEITPEAEYWSRRRFLKTAGVAAGAWLLSACAPALAPATRQPASPAVSTSAGAATPIPPLTPEAGKDELGDPETPYDAVTGYNNYYEFSMDKEGIGDLAKNLKTSPWSVEVGGLVNNPKTYDLDDLRKKFTLEERLYRMRCVEGWSMVIPWQGFSLAQLLKEADPTSAAKFVRFEALLDHKQMPGQQSSYFNWPYVEGLRLDEARHDLTLMATGLYGKDLPPQNGAPLRLVVPWKYGFKNIKAIVKIELVADMPKSLWMNASPSEYGFYANVNPTVDHPRWSQATERRIGEAARRKTLLFNGYEAQVASLYKDMDLRANF
jgi:methionine sulfoxide reductase catalytic subunit